MLIIFKSKAAGDVIMFDEPAKVLLEVMGKDNRDGKGIITVEQLPDAIARLRAAIEEDRASQTPLTEEDEEREAGRVGMKARVSLAQRAWPLLDMLERAQRDQVPVVWGV